MWAVFSPVATKAQGGTSLTVEQSLKVRVVGLL
jgi:hypothetical protein